MNTILTIIIISILGPILGSLIGVFKRPSKCFVYHMLSFSAGVMIAISFIELIPESINLSSVWITALGLIIGAFIMYIAERSIPHFHIWMSPKEQSSELKKTALFLIIGIFIHNFPEGMAIGLGSVTDYRLSYIIALAIAVHNIPEGICTSAPYYYCTGKRLKAFLLSSSTAIPIILGFIFTYYLFPVISESVVGLIVSITAGIMIYISVEELIPSSCKKISDYKTIFSFIIGVLFVVLLGAI